MHRRSARAAGGDSRTRTLPRRDSPPTSSTRPTRFSDRSTIAPLSPAIPLTRAGRANLSTRCCADGPAPSLSGGAVRGRLFGENAPGGGPDEDDGPGPERSPRLGERGELRLRRGPGQVV